MLERIGLAVLLAMVVGPAAGQSTTVNEHLELSFKYASEGRKLDSVAERKKAVDVFQVGLRSGSSEFAKYLKPDCRVLLQQQIEQLEAMNLVIGEMQAIFGKGLVLDKDGDKLCPLAEKSRRLDAQYALHLTAMLNNKCFRAESMSVQDELAGRELKGVSAFFCKGSVIEVMR